MAVVVALVTPHAYSQSASPVTGWLWSDNIGWIELNCLTDPAGCTGPAGNWGVSVDSGAVTGWAWSDNIGWVKFGGLSGFPSSGDNATLSDGAFSGWARACAGTASGTCASMTSRTDGWDGWISLSGVTLSGDRYGVSTGGTCTNDSNKCNPSIIGGAWGSDLVGWLGANISANPPTEITCSDSTHYNSYVDNGGVTHPAGACSSGLVCVNGFGCTNAPPVGCLSVNADVRSPSSCSAAVPSIRATSGDRATLYWTVSNVDACTLSGPGVSAGGLSGSAQTPVISGPLSYTLNCTLGGDTVASYTASLSLVPAYQER